MNTKRYQRVSASYLVFLLSAVVLVGLRLVLKLDFIDPQTGFYNTQNIVTMLFNGLYALFGVLLLVTSYSNTKNEEQHALPDLRPVSGAAVVFGIAVLFRALSGGYQFYTTLRENPAVTMEITLAVLLLVLSVTTGVVMLVLAVNMGARQLGGYAASPVLMVPVLYQCLRLIERFTKHTSPITVSDDTLEIFLLVLAILFMVAQARVLARVNLSKGYRLLQFSGYFCALTGLLLFLPQLFSMLLGRLTYTPESISLLACDAALTLYCRVFTKRIAG